MEVNTFVQLFVIHRFLKLKKEHETLLTIETENNVSKTIVSKLLKCGLSWIKDTSFDDNQCTKIFELYNFVVNKYPAMYENIISTKIDSNKYPFSNKVLNQSDIVTSILQHLDVSDVNNCSLVESGFLYHSFHCNSSFYVHTSDDHLYSIDKSRTWQRFLNARKVVFTQLTDDQHERCEASDTFWPNFCLMKNIEEINIFFNNNCGELLKLVKILSQASIVNRLKIFESGVLFSEDDDEDDEEYINTKKNKDNSNCKTDLEYYMYKYSDIESVPANVFASIELLLLNCERIYVSGSLFSIVISKKCHTLTLGCKCNINYSYKSSDNGIECDMSGIKNLSLENATFFRVGKLYLKHSSENWNVSKRSDNDNDNDNINGEELKLVPMEEENIISMAKECVNVENLEVGQPTSHSLLFWKTLQLNHDGKMMKKEKDLFIIFDPRLRMPTNREMKETIDCILENDLWMNKLTVYVNSGYQIELLTRLFKQGCKQLKDKLEIFVFEANSYRSGISSIAQCDQLWRFWGINKDGNEASDHDVSNNNKNEKIWLEQFNALKWLTFTSGDQFPDLELLKGILYMVEHLNKQKKKDCNHGYKGNVIGTQISMNVLIENIANLQSMDQLLSIIKRIIIARIPLMIHIIFEVHRRQARSKLYGSGGVKKFKNVYNRVFVPKFVFDDGDVIQAKLEKKEKNKRKDDNKTGGMPSWYEKPLWNDQDRFYQTTSKSVISLTINNVEFTKVDVDKVKSLEKVELIVKTANEK